MPSEPQWRSDEVLAWTDHDGPRRGPAGASRVVWFALAGIMGAVFAGMYLSDTLCPEHRAWVRTLGALALIGTATAAVGLVRGWAGAPLITLGAASIGVVIGIIDAAHDPARGSVIAVAFGVALATAAFLCVRQHFMAQWEQHELAPATRSAGRVPASSPHATPATAAPAAADARPVATSDTH